MPIETSAQTPNWTELEGKLLEGGYEIEQCTEAQADSASFKIRILGDRFTQATASVYAPGALPGNQVDIWNEAVNLKHTFVDAPLSAGLIDWDGVSLPYQIRHKPDETLAAAIAERPLASDEVLYVVRALLDALDFLHANGFVIGRVTPPDILAFGEQVKFSVTHLQRITADNETSADLHWVGAVVFEMLTQRNFDDASPDSIGTLPAPFNSIVKTTATADRTARLTTGTVRAMLRGEQLPPTATPIVIEPEQHAIAQAPAVVEAQPIAPLVEPPPSVTAAPPPQPAPLIAEAERGAPAPIVEPAAAPAQHSLPTRPARARLDDAVPSARAAGSKRKLGLIGLAVLFLVVLIWVLKPRHAASDATTSTATIPDTSAPSPSAAAPVRPTPTVHPKVSVPVPGEAVSQQVGAARGPGSSVWRVIVFTFNRQADAQKKADWINHKHPGLDASVFAPNGRAPFLVYVGGNVTRDAALRIRQRARLAGLPRDSYIQNYSR